MSFKRSGMLGIRRIRCFGGCIGGTDDQLAEPDVIDMSCPSEEFLHLKDFTANDADLMPMLPDEVAFHRVENFHCRNLTIADTSPIAVRKFEELTKELSTTKEPIAIELLPTLPFDLVEYHPSIDSQAPTVSDIDMSNKTLDATDYRQCKQMSMDEACYRLADRIYQMEKSKMKDRSLHPEYTTDAQWLNGSHSSTECTLISEIEGVKDVNYDGDRLIRRFSDDSPFTISHDEDSRDQVIPKVRTPSSDNTAEDSNHMLEQMSTASLMVSSSTSTRETNSEFSCMQNAGIPNTARINNEHQKLRHVSAYPSDPPIEFFDPFEDEHDAPAWPLTLGSHMWSLVVRGSSPPYYQDSIDISIEGTISSFYSKEEMRVLRQTFERLPRSEVTSIVESTISMLNK